MIVNLHKNTQTSESEPLPDSIDTGKTVITKPELIRAYLELDKKEKSDGRTVAESRQYYRLKKYGDGARSQNKLLGTPKNRPTRVDTLEALNNNPITPTRQKIRDVIDSVYSGDNPIEACKKNDIRPKDFFKYLDEVEFTEEKAEFFRARCILAEYYLHRREMLEKDLLCGKIDSSTYGTLASDYKYLAGKLWPVAYGEKIQLDAVTTTAPAPADVETVKELSRLLISSN